MGPDDEVGGADGRPLGNRPSCHATVIDKEEADDVDANVDVEA